MDYFSYFACTLLSAATTYAGRNLFASSDFNVVGMIQLKGVRVYDNLGVTKIVKAFDDCVSLCFSLNFCLSFNVVKSKPNEWLCHATRYNYKDIVSMKDLESSITSDHYAFNYTGCNFTFGDGTGGSDVKQRGLFAKPEDCILQCAQQKRFNGVTVDSRRGKQCWCEEKMTRRDDNDFYQSCAFEGKLELHGWLEVARLNTSKHGNFTLEDAESDDIGKLEQVTSGKFALSQAGLRALYEATNFTQLRFFCSKNHGRNIDIVTNSTQVISWLLGYVSYSTRPASCGSFFLLPDDNSMMSRRCNDWHDAKWGLGGLQNIFGKTMWILPFFVWGQQHWEFPSSSFPERGLAYLCDERFTSDNRGVWSILVK